MDKNLFKNRFQISHQKMMHHPVPEIRSKYLTKLGSFLHKTNGRRGVVGTGGKLIPKIQQVVQEPFLKTERIDGFSLTTFSASCKNVFGL